MAGLDEKSVFVNLVVAMTPEQPGVYCLFDGEEWIYAGRATVSMRNRLFRHLSGNEGECTQKATHFSYEACSNPIARETELLEYCQANYGCLPRCNERIG